MFCNTRPQRNCHSALRVDPKNVKGSCSSGYKLAIKRFVIFEDFLTNLVIKIDLLFVGMEQCFIDQLLSSGMDCLPISKMRNIEKHISRELKFSRRGL